jgi:hypothetical protein
MTVVAFDSLTPIPTGWFIFFYSHFLPRPKSSDFASESRGPISVLPESISVLPATVGRGAGPDLATTRIPRSSGFRPVRSPTGFHSDHRPNHRPTHFHHYLPSALPCLRTIIF